MGVPSIVYGSEWIGYENQESVIQKANYIKDNCLGGAMIWTVSKAEKKYNKSLKILFLRLILMILKENFAIKGIIR